MNLRDLVRRLEKIEDKLREKNDEDNRVIDDVLSIKVATRNAGKGIFMLSKYLVSIGKAASKVKVSDSE